MLRYWVRPKKWLNLNLHVSHNFTYYAHLTCQGLFSYIILITFSHNKVPCVISSHIKTCNNLQSKTTLGELTFNSSNLQRNIRWSLKTRNLKSQRAFSHWTQLWCRALLRKDPCTLTRLASAVAGLLTHSFARRSTSWWYRIHTCSEGLKTPWAAKTHRPRENNATSIT
jgi:hypothetical protein